MSFFTTAPTRSQAIGELFFAALLWGSGFIATRFALQGFQPFWVTALRFLLAFSIGLCFVYFNPWLKTRCNRSQFFLSAIPGFLLGSAILLQAIALQFTSITNCSFITCLYIVFVPPLEWLFLRYRIHWLHGMYVGVALVGAALICQWHPQAAWNTGDLLTFACAIVSAGHIVYLGKFGPRIESSFVFNTLSHFWSGLLPLIVALFLEPFPTMPDAIPLAALFFLAVPVNLVAFGIQVRSQKVLTASVASMLFLLESPFAALLAYWIFNEIFSPLQWLGGVLILVAAVGSTRLPILAAKG